MSLFHDENIKEAWPRCCVHAESLQLCPTLCEEPLSMGFSRQEYWSGLPCPPPGDLPDPGIEPLSPALQTDSLPLSHLGSQQMGRDQTIVLCSLLTFISLWLTPHMYYP